MDKSWDRLLVLEGKIAQAQTMKSFIQDQDEKAGLMWTDLMEEKLVADMMRAAKLRAMHVAWNEDLRKFQAQLDAIVLELQE